MKSIDLFYQGEGIAELAHLEVAADATFAILKGHLIERHGVAGDVYLFLEDEDEPVDEVILVKERATPKGCKVHIHRCRHVEVKVTFNAETVSKRFSPSATVARVKRWAAKELHMSDSDAGEHVLQIAGTHERPVPGTHIGSLTNGKVCSIAFDLVPDQRINGTPAGWL